MLPFAKARVRAAIDNCGKQFNERSGGVLNRASLPSDVIAFVVFCRLRYRLTLRDLSEIMILVGEHDRQQPGGRASGWCVASPTASSTGGTRAMSSIRSRRWWDSASSAWHWGIKGFRAPLTVLDHATAKWTHRQLLCETNSATWRRGIVPQRSPENSKQQSAIVTRTTSLNCRQVPFVSNDYREAV